jgi:hypothetical protein
MEPLKKETNIASLGEGYRDVCAWRPAVKRRVHEDFEKERGCLA